MSDLCQTYVALMVWLWCTYVNVGTCIMKFLRGSILFYQLNAKNYCALEKTTPKEKRLSRLEELKSKLNYERVESGSKGGFRKRLARNPTPLDLRIYAFNLFCGVFFNHFSIQRQSGLSVYKVKDVCLSRRGEASTTRYRQAHV